MSRKLNSLEQKIHQAALAADERTITNKELEALAPDQAARTGAINFLLGAGLLKVLKDSGGKLQFRAVVKKELDAKKDLSGEESLVLGHIQAAGNEGIWTKHIKVKTELHQTVIDRCLKSLTQKKLVKCISGSVQHPTRKIYMLFHLEPSTEMTGGPWYTDKELDTEFIKLLTAACLKFIRDRSFPRSKSGEPSQRLLYPISAAPSYPTAAQVQVFLNKSRITETQLTVEHVETLLNVLVLDGDVEKVPALGATLWESALDENDDSSSEEEKPKSKKRKREADSSKRKKKRRKTESSDESDLDSDDGSRRSKSKSKSEAKSKSKRRKKHATDSESDSGDESDSRQKKKKSKKRRSRDSSDERDSGSETESEDDRRKKKRSMSRSKSKSKRHASDSESDSESDAPKARSRSRSKSKAKREASPEDYAFDDDALGGAHVYRAVHAERMAHFGVAQAPCGRCPVFDFCTAGGPVNPQECVYYADWLPAAEVKLE